MFSAVEFSKCVKFLFPGYKGFKDGISICFVMMSANEQTKAI